MTTPEFYNLDRSITYPSHDIPVLRWWENVYDHVFVALHPFFRVPGYSPRSAAFSPEHIDRISSAEFMKLVLESRDRPNSAPDDFDATIKKLGQPVSWEHVNAIVGGRPFPEFSLAAWMATVEFRRDDSDENLIRQILEFADQTDLYLPEEDQFPAICETALGEMCKSLGISNLIVDDEFDERPTSVAAEVLLSTELSIRDKFRGKLSKMYDEEKSVLIITDFDAISSLIAIKDRHLEAARLPSRFEGFFATSDMFCDWINPRSFFKRKRLQPPN
ncbi:DUF2711 family protein [Mesorhizobium sp. KR9-304]|uniref:DUF2711 family protein n=1 Tax=Mesorhizobium sp. KR9-304 TaxID=3156614 RepID=UPI0032B3484E